MIDYATFSALRWRLIFERDVLEAYPYFCEVGPAADRFDTDYLGGRWDEELIDGVQLLYPQADGSKLGCIQLFASRYFQVAAARDRPGEDTDYFVSIWKANADRLMAVLDLPFRMGADAATVCALAVGAIRTLVYPDLWFKTCPELRPGSVRECSFACRAPHLYHVRAILHATEGLSLWKSAAPISCGRTTGKSPGAR